MSELKYHPVLADLDELLAEQQPARLLILGHSVPENVTEARTARVHGVSAVNLPRGIYHFESAEGAFVMALDGDAPPGAPVEADWAAPDDHPLINAYGWFCSWWEAGSEIPQPAFAHGDEAVTVPAGQEATIRRRSYSAGKWWYSVRVEGRTVNVPEDKLSPPLFDDDPFDWIAREPSPAHRFAATLTRAKLREELTDTVYSFRATRTLFRPYQFRPVIRLLESGNLRLLIADEVGLGKTIEAGLVWTELDARRQANRVLVVCPSMLVPKWREEMIERFGYELLELNRESLSEFLDRLEGDRLPARYRAVCSLERLRIWDGLERVAELAPRFDLVVVDEAHAFRNTGTKSNALGALLSDWADALLFLSATPLNLGNDDLYNLLELLAPGEFDDRRVLEERLEPNAVLNRISSSFFTRSTDNRTRLSWLDGIRELTFGPAICNRPEYAELQQLLRRDQLDPKEIAEAKRLLAQLHALSAVVTRTRKVEIQEHKAVREAIRVDVNWTPAEAEFYQAFDTWQRERARRLGMPVGFVTQMPLRLASSCLPAARDRILNWDSARWGDEDLDELGAEDDDRWEQLDDLPPPEVVDLARRLGSVDTKYDAFRATLLPIIEEGRRVLIFTFSRAALAYLQQRLSEDVRLTVMHGGVNRDDRHRLMQRFRAHDFDVLLASRVASEGLDFEFCSAIVNWDLPWNPMEVEQRIGRIDRFGQTEDKVLVLNFHTPGTIETDIIERVHRRIGVFEDSIGELEPILQSKIADLKKAMFDFSLSEDQRSRRIEETLTALEEQKLTREDVETAQSYLSSTDHAEIDGFEDELTSSGRYVGQRELVLLIQDWTAGSAEARCRVSSDGHQLILNGSEKMEEHLRGVQAAGERSSSELDRLARRLRDGEDIYLCLEQELARTTGQDLITSNHPLVRAALRVPGFDQARLAHIRYPAERAPAGTYLILLAIARWSGARPASEIWTAAVDLASSEEAPQSVGDALLAALAEARIADADAVPDSDLQSALRTCEHLLRVRQQAEEDRRLAANDVLIETRRISLRETHARKISQIKRRLETLRREGKTGVIHLQEAQLASQDRLLAQAEETLDAAQQGSMEVESIAVCVAEVTPP